MKIKRMQSGGGIIYTPFTPTAGEQDESAQTNQTPEAAKISGTFTKEIVDVLKENGIPSDVDLFMSQADNLLNKSQSLSSSILFGGSNQEYDIKDLMQVHSLANKVKFNKGLYDQAYDNLEKERSFSEVATDNRGNLFAWGENGLEIVSAEEFYKRNNELKALTNQDVLSMRENNPDLAFDSNLLKSMSNAVGTGSIVEYVKGIINDFGTRKLTGYTQRDQNAIENGMNLLMNGGPDGYYKYSEDYQMDKQDQDDMDKAMKYIWNTLSPNMKSLLRAKTAGEGGNPKSDQTVELLKLALMEHTSESYTVDYDKTATDSANGGGSGGSEALAERPQSDQIATGGPDPYEPINISGANSGASLIAYAQDLGRLQTDNGTPVTMNTLSELLGKTGDPTKSAQGLAKAVNPNSVTFGDTLISGNDYNKLLWEGTSSLKAAYLPYKSVNGKIMPDFDLQEGLSEMQEWITNQQPSNLEINEMVQRKFGNAAMWDPQKQILIPKNVMRFAVLSAVASSDSLDFDTDSPFVEKLSTQEGKQLTDMYDRFMKFGQDGDGIKGQAERNGGNSDRWSFYRANIYMPVENPGSAMMNYEMWAKTQASNLQPKMAATQNRQQISTNW